MDNGMDVIVLDSDIDMKNFTNVKVIRIKSKDYNLLIMKDYWPIVGELNGNIYIDGDESISYENVKGFYSLSHNVFHLIIRENVDFDGK